MMNMLKTIIICILALSALSYTHASGKHGFSIEIKEPADVFKWFPLEIGSEWTYQNKYEMAFGSKGAMAKVSWESKVRVTERTKTSKGIFVKMETVKENIHYDLPPEMSEEDLAWLKKTINDKRSPDYLIRGNYVFAESKYTTEVSEPADADINWNERCPDFFFPMSIGLGWAERNREQADFDQLQLFQHGKGEAPTGMYYWDVEGKEDLIVPAGKITGVYRLAYRSLGGPTFVWFKDGIGVVKTSFVHQGTPWEESSVLKKFVPAQKK
jgi:hypothetical protein